MSIGRRIHTHLPSMDLFPISILINSSFACSVLAGSQYLRTPLAPESSSRRTGCIDEGDAAGLKNQPLHVPGRHYLELRVRYCPPGRYYLGLDSEGVLGRAKRLLRRRAAPGSSAEALGASGVLTASTRL